MTYVDDMNKIFSFKDAVKTVENILNVARVERDIISDTSHVFYQDKDAAWNRAQERVEVLEDVLEALSNETGISHHVRAHDERGVVL